MMFNNDALLKQNVKLLIIRLRLCFSFVISQEQGIYHKGTQAGGSNMAVQVSKATNEQNPKNKPKINPHIQELRSLGEECT